MQHRDPGGLASAGKALHKRAERLVGIVPPTEHPAGGRPPLTQPLLLERAAELAVERQGATAAGLRAPVSIPVPHDVLGHVELSDDLQLTHAADGGPRDTAMRLRHLVDKLFFVLHLSIRPPTSLAS